MFNVLSFCSVASIDILRLHVYCIVTEQGRGWFTINYYRKDSPFLSVEVPPPPHTPARFKMPAARGKTSLNARDW